MTGAAGRLAPRPTVAAAPVPPAPARSLAASAGSIPILLPLAAALGGVVLYTATVAPTVLWGDDAELQRIVVTGEPRTIGQSSRASHLLWLALASGFVRITWIPLDAAGRANLLSALCAAAALPFVYLAAAELARSVVQRVQVAGVGAATAFAVSHTFWLLAVRPDVYTLQTALLAGATWAVLRWRRSTDQALYLAGAVVAAALALFNHVMILASGFGLAWLALAVPRRALRALMVVAGTASALVLIAIAAGVLRGVPLSDLVRAAASYHPQPQPLRDVLLVPAYLVYQFPLSLPLVAWGVHRLWQSDRQRLAGVALLYAGSALLMLLRSHPSMYVRDQFVFFLPSYVPVALVIGVGWAALVESAAGRAASAQRWAAAAALAAALLAPLALYPLAARAAGSLAIRLAPARELPGRDPTAYYLWPGKTGYVGAREYGETALAALPPQAALVADWLPYQTLRYLQAVEGQRPDVLLAQINAGGGDQLRFLLTHRGSRPLYLADKSPIPYYEMPEIERCFVVTPERPVFQLTPRPDAGVGCN